MACAEWFDCPVDLPALQVISDKERVLLLKIARCRLITAAARDPGHSCHQVVAAQPGAEGSRQVPEGWAGNLPGARVVFVSSNPAIGAPPDGQPPRRPRSTRSRTGRASR
jgi:hypothetical protein